MIRVEALTRTYGDLTAVDQVSFEIGKGEIVGLLGHNGAGKTTIMKMLTGYLEPTSGSIEVAGLDISTERKAVQQRIGYLPENDPLYYEMTVIDYLDYAATLHGVPDGERSNRIREAIVKTELTVKATQTIGTLSRGFCQRVGVAQAILHNPQLLILDEPTNGLDPTQVQHMRELIRSLAEHATVILSTHILQEVQAICDRIIIVHNGKKVLDSTMEELLAGKRLLVTIDVEEETALDLLNSIDCVASVEALSHQQLQEQSHQYSQEQPQEQSKSLSSPSAQQAPRYGYALNLGEKDDPADAAPLVASLIATQGWKLYELRPERHDLEQIFGEISAQGGQ
jgi:ABC-2 type transport system ATP-binding protein